MEEDTSTTLQQPLAMVDEKGRYRLECCDCFDLLETLEDESVDMVLIDPPYGTTDLSWDTAPDWGHLFAELKRVIKPHRAVICYSQMRPSLDIIPAAGKNFYRYLWVWEKTRPGGGMWANRMPLRCHEQILIFGKGQPLYNAIPIANQKGKPYITKGSTNHIPQYYRRRKWDPVSGSSSPNGERKPRDVVKFSSKTQKLGHPTAKPVELNEMLIGQYTKPGDLVLDCFFGSGSSGIAAMRSGRRFVGCELDAGYFSAGAARIATAAQETLITEV